MKSVNLSVSKTTTKKDVWAHLESGTAWVVHDWGVGEVGVELAPVVGVSGVVDSGGGEHGVPLAAAAAEVEGQSGVGRGSSDGRGAVRPLLQLQVGHGLLRLRLLRLHHLALDLVVVLSARRLCCLFQCELQQKGTFAWWKIENPKCAASVVTFYKKNKEPEPHVR